MVSFLGTETSPSSGDSSPTTMRKRVVLPEPLGPTSPTFSPGFNWNEASTKISCLPYCLEILEKEIMRKHQVSRWRWEYFFDAETLRRRGKLREVYFGGAVLCVSAPLRRSHSLYRPRT